MSKQGFSLTHVSAFSIGGSPRFAAIFEKGGPAGLARHGLTASGYQNAFNDFAKKGFRLKVVSGYRQETSDRYAAIWVQSDGPQWLARHGIKDAHYQHVFDNFHYQSWEPQYIEAFNSASGVCFNGLWENTTFSASDLALIRNKVHSYMDKNNVEGLSIAISRNERLVYAASFGFTDKEKSEPVGPAHRFRIASLSKAITHVAVMRVIQNTNLDLSSKVFGNRSVLGNQYATPSSNQQIEDITVDHLIRHRAGFLNRNKSGKASDPMFAFSGEGHKALIKWALEEYPLGYAPGKANPILPAGYRAYSNFGYCLIGRIIETRTRLSYESYVNNMILKPAGASSMVIGGDKKSDRKSNEVIYYGAGAYSSVKPTRFDSHGGWIATPIDLLRFMRHENVLSTPYSHTGSMAGTKAVLRRRSDGFTYAATSNSSNGDPDQINEMLKEIVENLSNWPNHDLF
jgi:CubicO group peptidase (beta-lactamase class C family)